MHLVAGGVLGDLLLDLDQGITELLDSQKSNMVAPDGPTQECSVGFRPGEHGGQSMRLNLVSSLKSTEHQ